MAQYDRIAVNVLANKRDGTLYTGVTNELVGRVSDHKRGDIPGFTRKYGCTQLVWFEQHEHMHAAIHREKRIKRWLRKWKLELIEKTNPTWRDLYSDLL